MVRLPNKIILEWWNKLQTRYVNINIFGVTWAGHECKHCHPWDRNYVLPETKNCYPWDRNYKTETTSFCLVVSGFRVSINHSGSEWHERDMSVTNCHPWDNKYLSLVSNIFPDARAAHTRSGKRVTVTLVSPQTVTRWPGCYWGNGNSE